MGFHYFAHFLACIQLYISFATSFVHGLTIRNSSPPQLLFTCRYESGDALLRLAWNKQDPNYLATILTDSPFTIILDIRMPSIPVAKLCAHTAPVNAVAWAPHSSCHICSCSDDRSALIWDLKQMPKPITAPILAYNAKDHINQLQWSAAQPFVAIAQREMQVARLGFSKFI